MVILHGQQYHNGGSESLFTENLNLTIEKANAPERIVKVLRTNQKKDGTKICKNILDNYFIKSEEPLYKLDLQLTPDGSIGEILNREEVLRKWELTKIYLDDFFVSEDPNVIAEIHRWTKELDQHMKDDSLFFNMVSNNLIYNCFFHGYWLDYGDNGLITRDKQFPFLFGDANLILTENMEIYDISGETMLKIDGVFNPNKSDIGAISDYLGLNKRQVNNLTVDLDMKCLFDEIGILKKLDMYVIAEMSDSDFVKQCGLTIKKD